MIIHVILEYAKDKTDIVTIQKQNTFIYHNNETALIMISYRSFYKIYLQHLPNHLDRVKTYVS